jgi:DNA/RNA endonuclease YhcR with UshA esterase domain
MKLKTSAYLMMASLFLLALAVAGTEKPGKASVSSIEPSDIGEKVRLDGEVVEAYSSRDSAFLTVSDGTGNISVVSFDGRTFFEEGEEVSLSGRVTMYEGELEVVADEFYLGS